MSDSEEIKDNLIDRLKDGGVKQRTIRDRTTVYSSPKEILDAAKEIAADENSDDGPFLKMRFTGRSF